MVTENLSCVCVEQVDLLVSSMVTTFAKMQYQVVILTIIFGILVGWTLRGWSVKHGK